MDITTVFGTVIGGSNPSGSTKINEQDAQRYATIILLLPEGFESDDRGPISRGGRSSAGPNPVDTGLIPSKNHDTMTHMKKKVVVIGGQGFIGSHVVDNLLSKGHEVTVFDRVFEQKLTNSYEWEGKVHFLIGDLTKKDTVDEAVSTHDVVINLGGLLGTSEMVNDPIPAIDVNITGAIHVFNACKIFQKRGLQISVGNYWMNNPYSITKHTAERFALMYNKEHKTDIRVLRGMNIYGERQKHRPIRKIFPNTVIPALLGKDITVYGSGEQVMDLMYVKDFAEVVVRVALYDDIPNNVVFESGVGGGMTINKAVQMVINFTNSASRIVRVPMRPGEEEGAVVEISEAGWKHLETNVGYSARDLTPMEAAMKQSIEWYRAHLADFQWDE